MEISNLGSLPSLPPPIEKKFNDSYSLYDNNTKEEESQTDISFNFNFNLEESEDEENDIFFDSYESFDDIERNFNKISLEESYFKNTASIQRDMKNSLLKDFIVIHPKAQSQKNMSMSFKNYLNNSLYFIKESYNYIRNFNSL